MKPQIRVDFAYFWPGFTPESFRTYFPYVYEKYDLVATREAPEVVFYSVFVPRPRLYVEPRYADPVAAISRGNYVRVFLSGEITEPMMNDCEFAISFSALVDHPNHLRLPLWVYENRAWGYGPERLVKADDVDWEKVAAEKSAFCNFIYTHDVPYRNAIFSEFDAYKRVDAAGSCMNSMGGWTVPKTPNRLVAKLDFVRRYKFTLAIEHTIWPGYLTEKLVDPMYVNSIPIYVGDPQARVSFNPDSYIDFASFGSMKEMLEFVREVDNDRDLYLKMLAAPFYRDNRVPDYVKAERILVFFDRIFEAALARRTAKGAA